MTYDEAKQRLTQFVEKPDTMAAEMPVFLDLLKGDYETLVGAQTKVAEQDDRIRTLQDTNTRLFLMQTGKPVDNEVKEELQGHDAVDAFVADIMKPKGKDGD